MRAGVHARRDADFQLPFGANLAFPAALRARPAHNLAASPALVAGTANLQKTLLINHLATPVTHGAAHQAVVLFGPRALATRTYVQAGNLDLDTHSSNGILQGNFQVVAQIFATLRARASPAPPRASKQIAQSEKIAQDIAEVGEGRGIEAWRTAEALQTLMPIAVVSGTLLRVAEHAIGFGGFLELFLRFLIVGVPVGMEFERQFSIGALQARVIDLAPD